MDVILHIGAHRCATTSFQHYLRRNSTRLAQDGIGFWGPFRTRAGLFRDVAPSGFGLGASRDCREKAVARVRRQARRSARRGVRRLIVSDENMLGAMPHNMRDALLYPLAADRLSAFATAFDGRVAQVVLNVRELDRYWTSAMAFGCTKRRAMPGPVALDWIARGERSWRDVVADVAEAVPGARVSVLPFECFAGRPDAQLSAILGETAPRAHRAHWLNGAPRAHAAWTAFSPRQAARLRAVHADDLAWLASGACRSADLIGATAMTSTGNDPSRHESTRGRCNDQDRRLAGAG